MWHVQLDAEECGDIVDILVHGQQHLDTNKDEDDAQAVFQVLKVLSDGSQCEIQGAQAKDGEDVRRQDDERIAAHREHGRDGVDGKGHVSGLDNQQGDKERRGEITAFGFWLLLRRTFRHATGQ